MSASPAASDPHGTGAEAAPGGLRVLVVEDNEGDRWFFSDLLRGRGYDVISCGTGESAWHAFQERPADIVLLDIMLPGMDGEALCRRIRGHESGSVAIILAATGRDERDALQPMLDAGADDFLRKPVDPDLLAVRLAIAERRLADRSERAVADAALERKSRELETLFANVREVFVSIDVSAGRLIQVSDQAEVLFGVSTERLVREPDLWKDYFKLGVAWEDLVQAPPEETLHHEYPVTSASGDRRWLRASVSFEKDEEAGGLRADGVVVDRTSEREARDEAAARNEELSALHTLSEITLSASTLEEAYQRIIEHAGDVMGCSIAAIEQLDTSRDRLVVVAARGIDIPSDAPPSVALHQTLSGIAVRTRSPVIERDPQHRAEHEVPYLSHLDLKGYAAFPLVAGGEVGGTLMFAALEAKEYDDRFLRMGTSLATSMAVYLERLEAESALRENEARYRTLAGQLQQANEELQSFAYSVSHDLRAPLRTMQGFAHALLQNFEDELPPEAQDYARRIIASGQQSEGLIRDLLNYSRLSFERVEVKGVDLRTVVSTALEQVQADIQEADAHVTVGDDLPAVLGSHTTLVQVLANLVANAVKFVPTSRKPEVRIETEDLGGYVRVCVEDNGIGIPDGQEERIFRVFERLAEGSAHPGTGIGLAIVRRGMQRIGGTCGVEPLPEGGSRFWIEVPKERRSHPRGLGRGR